MRRKQAESKQRKENIEVAGVSKLQLCPCKWVGNYY
jgi:hypothetical protein